MHQISLTASRNVLVIHINEHLCQSMCLKCPPLTRTHLKWSRYWSIAVSMVRVKPSLHQAFSQVFKVMNLYFMNTLLYKIRNKQI